MRAPAQGWPHGRKKQSLPAVWMCRWSTPSLAELRAEGIDISDARPGDTVFAEMLDGRFDGIIAMTHDQGLIPVKTLDFWGGVNTTLGLPIVRTSPDHGTAYDAARDNAARPDSLISAIRLARKMASNRPAHV